jgi:hypothetical protein
MSLTPADRLITPAVVEQILNDYELAKRALKWMLEHKVYWDARQRHLLEPVSLAGRTPLCRPPADLDAFIHGLALEVRLEAESAG